MPDRMITQAEAIREAIDLEMARDESVITLGEGVPDPVITYGTTRGLAEKYGPDRVQDTPLSEDAMTGVVIGASLMGLRPIHFHQRMDFLMLAMNQIVNIAAKSRYMHGGQVNVPIVIRSVIGRSWGQGAQHSQGLHSFFMHIPGLKVVAPSTPYDAKGTMIAAIRDNNPVLYIEHRMLHRLNGLVPEGSYIVPIGKARLIEKGDDITIVGISYMVVEAIRAAHHLRSIGVTADVIDPVTLSPLDIETIVKSVEKTKCLLVVDSSWTMCGASSEIVSQVVERVQPAMNVRVRRMGFEPVPCPTTRNLENLFYPNPQTIASAAHSLLYPARKPWAPTVAEAPEVVQFRGPF